MINVLHVQSHVKIVEKMNCQNRYESAKSSTVIYRCLCVRLDGGLNLNVMDKFIEINSNMKYIQTRITVSPS